MPTRILLADDHTIMRQGLRQILEHEADFTIVAEAGSGLDAIEQAQEHQPDVAVVDIAMKELNGIEATAQILKRAPKTKVLILSMYSDERYVISAVKAGARGYVLESSAGDELLAEGNCNKDIANRLDLSLHTVETHRWRIMEKMNLHSMAELVLSAVRRGIVS